MSAINRLLSTIGVAPVSSLTTLSLTTELAQTAIDNVSRDLQSTPWGFNTERDVEFTAESDGSLKLDGATYAGLYISSLTSLHRLTQSSKLLEVSRRYGTVSQRALLPLGLVPLLKQLLRTTCNGKISRKPLKPIYQLVRLVSFSYRWLATRKWIRCLYPRC